jgi:uncharacterized membrane protein
MRKSFEVSNQLKETLNNLDYWKECSKTYECSIKEITQDKVFLEKKLADMKTSHIQLEEKHLQLQSRTARFLNCCMEMLSVDAKPHDSVAVSLESDFFPAVLKSIK